jgi:hypothetical protein
MPQWVIIPHVGRNNAGFNFQPQSKHSDNSDANHTLLGIIPFLEVVNRYCIFGNEQPTFFLNDGYRL